MRVLLLALMIALLPVRGWIGDAMATGMATGMAAGQLQHPPEAAKSIASHAHETGMQAHFDHEAVAPAAAQAVTDCASHASDGTSHTADTHCGSCSVCQACQTVALSTMAPDLTPVVHRFTRPRAVAPQFASAEAALGQKPPIS